MPDAHGRTSSASQVELSDSGGRARVFIGPGPLRDTELAPLPFDSSTQLIDPDVFESELEAIGHFVRRGFVLKRGYRPCRSRLESVVPRGRPVYFEITLSFSCDTQDFAIFELRFARALPANHRHELTLLRPDATANTFELEQPFILQRERGSVESLLWVYGSAGARSVFATSAVMAFFVLLSLSGLMARPDQDIRFSFIAAVFLGAGLLRPLYWSQPSELAQLAGLGVMGLVALGWLLIPAWVTHSAVVLAPLVGTLAGSAWLDYGWPGNFGLLAWLALAATTLGAFTLGGYLAFWVADGAFNPLRSNAKTALLVLMGAGFSVCVSAAGNPEASVLLIPHLVAAASVMTQRRVRVTELSRIAVWVFLACLGLLVLARVT